MSKIKLRQFWYRLKHDYLTIENVLLIVAVALCLFWTYQSITSMSRNWELAETLQKEQKSLELLQVEVETAELENEYYASEEYQELAARKLLNKEFNGEHLVYLPANSETAKTKHQTTNSTTTNSTTTPQYSNFEIWLKFLFPNQS